MADVFLSYKSEDRDLVANLAHALEREGVKVWWDRKIAAGGGWRETIVAALRQSKVVIAVWSKRTEDLADAAWVLNEVDEAGRLGKPLIPVMVEKCEAPFGYRHVQAADLSNWRGEPNHPEWRDVQAGVRAALAGRRVVAAAPATQSSGRARAQKRGGGWLAPLTLCALMAAGGYAMMDGRVLAALKTTPSEAATVETSEETVAAPEIAPPETPAIENESERRRSWRERRWGQDRDRRGPGGAQEETQPLLAVDAEMAAYVGRDNVRGVFRRTRGEHWVEQNNEAGRAGNYHVTRVGAHDIEMLDEVRGLYALIDFESGQISIKSRGEEHYHARYLISEARDRAMAQAAAD